MDSIASPTHAERRTIQIDQRGGLGVVETGQVDRERDFDLVLWGASGFTGRLVAEALRNYQIPFIAAGRNKARVEEAMGLVPGIETADYEVVEVNHDLDSLVELFSGAQVVCNTVGPFLYFGPLVVEACAKARVHYLDTTGENTFIEDTAKDFGDEFEAAGKVYAPCTAYMYTPLEIAALILFVNLHDRVDQFIAHNVVNED